MSWYDDDERFYDPYEDRGDGPPDGDPAEQLLSEEGGRQ